MVRFLYPTVMGPTAAARPTGRPDRRHLRRDRTRALLIEAARELMGGRGADGTTITEITETAGVGKGSFYNHFDSRDELFEAVMDQALAGFAARILGVTDSIDDPAEVIAVSIRHFVRLATGDPEVGRFLVRGAAGRALVLERIGPWARRDLERGLASGRFRSENPDLFAAVLAGSVESVIRGVLDGRLGRAAGAGLAAAMLRLLGLSEAEANELARRPLPAIPKRRGPVP